jgi:hypothetical protein
MKQHHVSESLQQLTDEVIRKLRKAGQDARTLENVRATAYTSSSEWLGDLGLAVREIEKQQILDESLKAEMAAILTEVEKTWPEIRRQKREDIHPELRGKVRWNQYVSTPLLLLIACGIFVSVLRAGLRGDEPWLLLALRGTVGVLFVWAAWYIWNSATWYRRASWVLQHMPPVRVRVHFGSFETAPIANILPITPGPCAGWVVTCHAPKWNIDMLEGKELLAHVDPVPGGPLVLETTLGILWPLERTPTREMTPEHAASLAKA